WAAAEEKITVRFKSKTYKTTTGSNGRWKVKLVPAKAGGPFRMSIVASNHIAIKDILIGDGWPCSGQSNMVHQMSLHSVLYADEIPKANYPQIRQFWVPNVSQLKDPQTDLPFGYRTAANPKDVLDFSAVAYFFANKIHEKYRVPIGLINASCWGGTPIQAWMSEESFKEFPRILGAIRQNSDTAFVNGTSRKAFTNLQPPGQEDRGMGERWFSTAYVPKNWRTISIPGYWEDQGIRDLDGVVWYRRKIDVPAFMTTVPAKVFLGRIVDADVLYINAKEAGATTYLYPQRRYNLPAGTLKPGKNLFVVRVTNKAGKGGFVPGKPYQLIAGTDTIDLTGYWQYKVGQANVAQPGFSGGIAAQNQPAALYNAMITPLTNYAVKGFLWYQGESSTALAEEYNRLQPALIADWRHKWNAPHAPFLYVQLPGFGDMRYLPSESQWAYFREAQLESLSVLATAMAVAIDLGEWNDIHPDRKKEVGERLALAAEKLAYGDDTVVHSGPVYQLSTIEENKIILLFTNVGSGLITIDGEGLSEFAIAGANKHFVWAKAKIAGDKVVVWSDEIKSPLYIRYAWSDFPVHPNFYHKEGLPASPFRTDK
ncbi:MAG TPA: sialate O-acetylesterase, partial [Flavisolibacter sp.]|nr:sialate O-acetylesterase [Flavisolibacter sp.]